MMMRTVSGAPMVDPIQEAAAILAAGLQRLLERKSSQKSYRIAETPLDCRARSEGHVRKKAEDVTP
jgi:hypothetical protein